MMLYLACVLYVAVIYIRPGEIVPGWLGVPFTQIFGVIAAGIAAISLMFNPRRIFELPNDWCFCGFCAACVLSHPANGWVGGGYIVLLEILPLVLFYLVIRVAVRTDVQLRRLMAIIVVLTLFQAAGGIVQYHTGVGFGGSTAYMKVQGESGEEGEPREIRRIRGTGIFNDPNDLAMSFVIVVPFLVSAILEPGSAFGLRLVGLMSFGVLMYAFLLTQSRGGFLALVGLSITYLGRRFGRIAALTVGVIVVGAMLAAGPSRFQEIDSTEASAQGRIQAWAAGLQMLKARPLLGIGFGSFADENRLVAHNSFVHALAELGLVGGYFFIGLFYWYFVGNRRDAAPHDAPRRPLGRDLWTGGVGLVICALFLSRQYSPVLYVLPALETARASIGHSQKGPRQVHSFGDWLRVLFITAGVVVATYILVRVLAIWS